MKRAPGRPRQFDLEFAQKAILGQFWEKGYSATSVEDLSLATGMVKPSLYSAFGNKFSMYEMALTTYGEMIKFRLLSHLNEADNLNDALTGFFDGALDMYCGKEVENLRGCMIFATAIAESINNSEVRAVIKKRIDLLDNAIAACFKRLSPQLSDEEIASKAWVISSSLHTISIRARAGTPRSELEPKIKAVIENMTR